MRVSSKKKTIKKLESWADEVLKFKQELGLRRPILIEFCGSPKSGKTSCINSLNLFLKRNGFKTIVLTERASVCPIEQKKHPYFNIWTACSAIAEIVKNLSVGKDNIDVILADRAIFDALCWFEWLCSNPSIDNPSLNQQQFDRLRGFLNMDLLNRNIDLVYVFKADPKCSMDREYANLLTEKTGSIMNEPMLNSINIAINAAIERNRDDFRKIEVIDTTLIAQDQVSLEVTSTVLEILKDLLEEKVGYINNSVTEKLSEGINSWATIKDCTLNYDKRSEVELTNHLQPVPIAVFTNYERNKVLVLKKNSKRVSKDSPEKDKVLIYAGGHIRFEDQNGNNKFIDVVRNTFRREMEEELGESITVNSEPYLIYTPSYNEKSSKHIAVCFVITMDLKDKKFKPRPEEFIQKSGKSMSGQVLDINDLISHSSDLDSWSYEILSRIFNLKPKTSESLFE
jgi:predicted NUDIX family phosphoesterase